MICSKCNEPMRVSHSLIDGRSRYRRRYCPKCKKFIYTEETEAATTYARLVIDNYERDRMAEYRRKKNES